MPLHTLICTAAEVCVAPLSGSAHRTGTAQASSLQDSDCYLNLPLHLSRLNFNIRAGGRPDRRPGWSWLDLGPGFPHPHHS